MIEPTLRQRLREAKDFHLRQGLDFDVADMVEVVAGWLVANSEERGGDGDDEVTYRACQRLAKDAIE